MSDGIIKFHCTLVQAPPLANSLLVQLNLWRDKLYTKKFIGADDNGIGYGNLSIRKDHSTSFIITGSSTGRLAELNGSHYTEVVSTDFEHNALTCIGPIPASSESLSHAAIYESDPTAMAVIHIHDHNLWTRLYGQVPTTAQEVPYGTLRMVEEIQRLFRETEVKKLKVLVMGGHEDGIIVFGNLLNEAGQILLDHADG